MLIIGIYGIGLVELFFLAAFIFLLIVAATNVKKYIQGWISDQVSNQKDTQDKEPS